MFEGVLEAPISPRPEDYGLAEGAVQSGPQPLVAPRQGLCIVVAYGIAAALVLSATLALSGSVIAAVFFGILIVAAGSVLLIPAVTGLVCVLERCEHNWLCRRYAQYRALSEYRDAVKAYEEDRQRFDTQCARASETFWQEMDRDRLVAETANLFRASGSRVSEIGPRADTGADLLVVDNASVTAVRCETGRLLSGLQLGRELASVRLDAGADRLVLVAPLGADPVLMDYLASHAASVLDAGDLVGLQSSCVG